MHFQTGGFILRDASLCDAPQDEVLQSLMVRSAATPRVSNHVARLLRYDDRNHWESALGAGVERR